MRPHTLTLYVNAIANLSQPWREIIGASLGGGAIFRMPIKDAVPRLVVGGSDEDALV